MIIISFDSLQIESIHNNARNARIFLPSLNKGRLLQYAGAARYGSEDHHGK
jgi:hypothetical protein